MNAWQTLLSSWYWASPAWLAAAVGLAVYWRLFRGTIGYRIWPLLAGLALFVLAFVSPIGVLADGYLFSAHLVQHLLLLLVVPLLLVLSLPRQRVGTWCERCASAALARWLCVPAAAWIFGVGAMWFWHVPSLCSASTQNALLGVVRDTTFLLAGLAFWWPIYAPIKRYRLAAPQAIVYLFSACVGCTLLGIYITFTTISVCPAFANPADRLGILIGLHDLGLTSGADQQLGGLLMWVPPCMLYVGAVISVLCRWYSTIDEDRPTVRVTAGLLSTTESPS